MVATGVGAFIAWTLGMIPSTLMSVTTDSAAQTQQMSDAMMYWLAVLMGFVLGLILGIPQWFVLRRYVRRAGWWVLANAIAWAAAMPLTFIGAAVVPANGFGFVVVVIVFLAIALAGATAGAIHGFALVWLLQSHQLEAELASPSEANAALQSTGSAVTKSLGAAGRKASI